MSTTRSWQPLSKFDFHHTTAAHSGVALVLFGQAGCGACRAAKTHLPRLLPTSVDALFEVDVAVSSALAYEFELFHLPALALYQNGAFHAWVNAPLTQQDLVNAIQSALLASPEDTP